MKIFKKINGIPFSVEVQQTAILEGTMQELLFGGYDVRIDITTAVVTVYSTDKKKVLDVKKASSKLDDNELGPIEAITRAVYLTELPEKKRIVKDLINEGKY